MADNFDTEIKIVAVDKKKRRFRLIGTFLLLLFGIVIVSASQAIDPNDNMTPLFLMICLIIIAGQGLEFALRKVELKYTKPQHFQTFLQAVSLLFLVYFLIFAILAAWKPSGLTPDVETVISQYYYFPTFLLRLLGIDVELWDA